MWTKEQPRQPLTGLALCAAAGIWLGDFGWVGGWILLPVVVSLGVLARRSARAFYPLAIAAFCLLHTWNPREGGAEKLASQLGFQPRQMQVKGVVADEPRRRVSSRGETMYDFPLRLERATLDGATRDTSAQVLVHWMGAEPVYGDLVELTGEATNVKPPRNPGEFDFAGAMQRRGIFSEIRMRYPEDGRITAHDRGSWIYTFALRARHWMERKLSLGLGDEPEKASLIRGMVLGSRADTPPDIEDLFRTTGTMHLFAVSGLNVAMFAWIAWGVLKVAGLKRKMATPVLIAIVMFYAVLTGLSASGLRAAVMTGVLLGAFLADRPALPLNNLGLAVCLILVVDTNQLFATGFQLSFVVVLAIFVFAEPISSQIKKVTAHDPFLPARLLSRWQRLREKVGAGIAGLIGVSVAAWLGSLLLNLHYFHLLSPWTVLANLVVVPVAFGVLGTGTLSLLCAPVSTWLVTVFNHANLALISFVLMTVKFFADLPGSAVYVTWPDLRPAPLASINVLDLGNGAGVHLRSAGTDWMIDCGKGTQYRWITRSYLRSRGINGLDGLLLTHGDIEHIGAAQSMLKDFSPGLIGESVLNDRSSTRRALRKHLAELQFGRCLTVRGDLLPLSSRVSAQVLYPPGGVYPRTADDKALVLRLIVGNTRVLMMSDAGFVTEQWLMKNEPELQSDILIKGQHSADLSGTPEFLNAVQPRVLITSAADFPKQARLPEEWTRMVETRGIQLFRQDVTGAVTVELRSRHFTVRSFLTDQTFRSNNR